jgi:hypothetical protein
MPESCEVVNGQRVFIQLNVVTVVDLRKAVGAGTLDGALYMMDNGLGSEGQGTAHLQTACKPGQVINWIIYPMDGERRPDGTWPPIPRINNIVFLGDQESSRNNVSQFKVCSDLKIFGMPDMMRSPFTPVYYYWAGTVVSNLEPSVYRYRFVLELEKENSKEKIYLNSVEMPSLKVTGSASSA